MHYKWLANIMFICFCGSMVSSTDFNSLFWKCCFIRNTQCWKYEILFKMHYKWLAKIKFISLCGSVVSSTNFNSLFWKCCFIRNTQMLKIWNFIQNALRMVGKDYAYLFLWFNGFCLIRNTQILKIWNFI